MANVIYDALNSSTVTGTSDDDILIAAHDATSVAGQLLVGGAGHDVIFGDHDALFFDDATILNDSVATAVSIDNPEHWSTKENPDIGNISIPYTSVLAKGDGTADFYAVTIGAGQSITIDVDYADGFGGFDSFVELKDSSGNTLIDNDNGNPTAGGLGSAPTGLDSYLSYTRSAGSAQVFYIKVNTLGETGVTSGGVYMLNVSVTNHAATDVATFGDDIIQGDDGDDVLYGLAGNDTLDGGDGLDTVKGGTGDDTLLVSLGADILEGGEGTDTLQIAETIADNTLANFVIDLAAGTDNFGNTFASIENVNAGVGNDTITGDGEDNVIQGGSGIDILNGGAGLDTLSYEDSASAVEVDINTSLANLGDAANDTFSNFENLTGSAHDDHLFGDTNVNVINGLGGDDTISGQGGTDMLFGGDGDDSFALIEGQATLFTGTTFDGGAGVDRITALQGALTGPIYDLRGTTLNSIEALEFQITGSSPNVAATVQLTVLQALLAGLTTLTVDDTLGGASAIAAQTEFFMDAASFVTFSGLNFAGGYGDNIGDVIIIQGDADDETIIGTDISDQINGEAGDDVLTGGLGADALNGGTGVDTAIYSASSQGVSVDLSSGIGLFGDAEGDTLSGIEIIVGSTFDDNLSGDASDNILEGSKGHDILTARAGNDTLLGGKGDDTLDGGFGNDGLFGGAGDDMIYAGLGNDRFEGGDGVDTVSYENADGRVAVFLTRDPADVGSGQGIDTFITIENVIGTNFDDRLVGDANDNELSGGSGADVLIGLAGDDILNGGDGADELTGNGGNDTLNGGFGADILSGLGGADILNGGGGADEIYAGLGVDTVYGNAGDDLILGNFGQDTILGGLDNDDIRGGGSSDILDGGDGNDKLIGGNGQDTLTGGAGDDILTGGDGAGLGDGLRDVFVFLSTDNGGGGFDRIRDFEDTTDKLDLSNSGYVTFADVLTDASQVGAHVQINFDAGGIVQIENLALVDLTAGDFIF
ncbi:MAG: calcium-binding protein [Aliishimia sp.]